jgi:hypothetical protein
MLAAPAAPAASRSRSVRASRGTAAAAAASVSHARGGGGDDGGKELYQSTKRRRFEAADVESATEVRASVAKMPSITMTNLNHMQRSLLSTLGPAFLHPDATSSGAQRAHNDVLL